MTLAQRVAATLARGGTLAERWPRYEDRAAQRAMAEDVAATIERGGVLLAEAPTGVGKSIAYLLPAVEAVLQRDRRVMIATCTKSLQDQLFERDLPALLEVLGVRVPIARLKGKQNYLCPQALQGTQVRGAEEQEVLEALAAWAASDESGDLDRFPAEDAEAYRRVRPRVAADPVACSIVTCRRGRECFWVRARRRAAEARILIVNHALLALAESADGLLPEVDVLIVDEAHRLEGVLHAQLEVTVSRHRFEEAMRLVGAGRGARASGLSARLRGLMLPLFDERGRTELNDALELLGRGVADTRDAVERFFAAVEPRGPRHELYGARERYGSSSELLGADLEPLETLLGHCRTFSRTLGRLADRTLAPVPGGGAMASVDELAAELQRAAALWSGLESDLDDVGGAGRRDIVYWRSAGGRGLELHAAPISVEDSARRLVGGRARATILTSATLTAGEVPFTAERLGLGESGGVPYEATGYTSPFALERQMRAYIAGAAARPEAEQVAEVVAELAEATGRNVLVLFTAHERLRRARAILRERLPASRVLLAQEWDGTTARVSERFRRERGAILLGVQSLWEGVDFPGEALEVLVVAKLPFAVPDDPLIEARAERWRDRGEDPFMRDAVPEAVLRFRQGVGRLIRTAEDRGVLVVCDPRLAGASYRRPFLAALPAPPLRFDDARALAADAAEFLDGTAEPAAAETPVLEDA